MFVRVEVEELDHLVAFWHTSHFDTEGILLLIQYMQNSRLTSWLYQNLHKSFRRKRTLNVRTVYLMRSNY